MKTDGICLSCTSARVLVTGPRTGALWCFVKRAAVAPSSGCPCVTESAERTASAGWDHVLVKSDPKAHFDPFSVEESAR